MKSLLVVFVSAFCLTGSGQINIQSNDSLKLYKSAPVDIYTPDYMNRYNAVKRVIYKVYPYALLSADMLDEIMNNAAAIEKRRKINKFYKDSYEALKDTFKYVFYELTTYEGKMLMKLVHRETGLTVYEIAEKYRGKKNAAVFNLMGLIWDQDLSIKFDPLGEDKIAEHVIHDIQSGLIPFNDDAVTIDKLQYRQDEEEYKELVKKRKEQSKAIEKRTKAKKKAQKKELKK